MNRSEELCKLLNIPKKYRGSRWGFIDRTYFVDSQIFDTEEDAKGYNNEEEFSVEELSVDLTKPSNFVKLKQINNPKYIDEFIDFLTHITKTNQLVDANSFKHQAQATKWDY